MLGKIVFDRDWKTRKIARKGIVIKFTNTGRVWIRWENFEQDGYYLEALSPNALITEEVFLKEFTLTIDIKEML